MPPSEVPPLEEEPFPDELLVPVVGEPPLEEAPASEELPLFEEVGDVPPLEDAPLPDDVPLSGETPPPAATSPLDELPATGGELLLPRGGACVGALVEHASAPNPIAVAKSCRRSRVGRIPDEAYAQSLEDGRAGRRHVVELKVYTRATIQAGTVTARSCFSDRPS